MDIWRLCERELSSGGNLFDKPYARIICDIKTHGTKLYGNGRGTFLFIKMWKSPHPTPSNLPSCNKKYAWKWTEIDVWDQSFMKWTNMKKSKLTICKFIGLPVLLAGKILSYLPFRRFLRNLWQISLLRSLTSASI